MWIFRRRQSQDLCSVVELRWGRRGPGPPERPGGSRETSVLRGIKGACKRPLKLQDDHPLFIDALLQFATVFLCTEVAVEKHFDPRNVTSGGASGGLKKFLGSLSLAIFYGPLINYAVIRPLPLLTTVGSGEESVWEAGTGRRR